jgi:hypothetical protein
MILRAMMLVMEKLATISSHIRGNGDRSGRVPEEEKSASCSWLNIALTSTCLLLTDEICSLDAIPLLALLCSHFWDMFLEPRQEIVCKWLRLMLNESVLPRSEC